MRISDWSSDVCSSDLQEQETAMRLYQVNLPGGPVMVFAHTIQRAWIMAFTRYAYDCDPDPAFAWDATEEWLAASDGQRSEARRVGKGCVSTCRSRWSPSH